MGSRGGFHVTHSSSHRLRMSFSSYLLCWVLSTGWMQGSVGRPMTSESEHCCRGENLGDALLQQQEVGRRGRARGLRLGLAAIALGILPLPIVVAFFLFGGHARFPGPPQDAGRIASTFHSLTLRTPKIRPDPVGFPAFRQKQEGKKISKNANPSCSCRVANSKSRKFDKKPDCASYTAVPTASLRAFKNREFRTSEDAKARTFASVSEKPDPREHNTTRRGTAHTSRRPLAYSCSRPDLQSVSTHPR